jgi:hypothetical protein
VQLCEGVMKYLFKIAAGLSCSVALAAFGANRVGEQRAMAPIDLPLAFANVDVTRNIKRRFGAPHVAVNPKNPTM